VLFALFVVSLAACAYFSLKNPTFAFYMIVTRFGELLAGFALAYAFARSPATIGFVLQGAEWHGRRARRRGHPRCEFGCG